MSGEKVLTLRGKKTVWAPGGGTGPIDPKRLPEGYPYKESSEVVICEEFTSESSGTFANSPDGSYGVNAGDVLHTPTENAKYTITLNGVSYDAVCKKYNGQENNFIISADGCVVTYWVRAYNNVDWTASVYADNGVLGFTMKLTSIAETIHTMDPEFLPEGYPYKEETYMDNYEGQVTVTIGADGTNTEDMICAVDDGAKYKVTWDGKDYFATAKADEQDADKIYAFRTADGFPFDMYCTFVSGGMPKLIIENAVPGDHTFQIFFVTETVHPMDEEYIQLTSPNGTKYKLSVANDGTLSAVKA